MHRLRVGAKSAALALALIFGAGSARADDSSTLAAPRYVGPQPTQHYVRAAAEELSILVIGVVQYQTETANSRDWDLNYDWPSFRKKLTGEAVRFDTNHFDTNMLTHPVSGSLYYVAARGNRLTAIESLLYATAASTLWEYVAEFREMVSVNDLIVTPLSGAAVGETLTQLGIYIQRSRPSLARDIVAAVLAPSNTIHDRLDGAKPRPSSNFDRLGLSRDAGHVFEVSAGAGLLWAKGVDSEVIERLALHAQIIDVGHYHAPHAVSGWLNDGRVTRLDIEGSSSRAGWDYQFDAEMAPVGYYRQDLRGEGKSLTGYRLFAGTGVGFAYGLHHYAASGATELDRIAGVHAGGLWFHHDTFAGRLHAQTNLEVYPEFATVQSLALRSYYAAGHDATAIPSVTVGEGYYYALGAVAIPSVELSLGSLGVGAYARLEGYGGIEGLDRHQEDLRTEASLHDRRILGRAWVGWTPTEGLAVRVTGERRLRFGDVAGVSASQDESALIGSAGITF